MKKKMMTEGEKENEITIVIVDSQTEIVKEGERDEKGMVGNCDCIIFASTTD